MSHELVKVEPVLHGEIVQDRVVKDGKVAVLVSHGFGAGWSTWDHEGDGERAAFCPRIVNMLLEREEREEKEYLTDQASFYSEIQRIAAEDIGEDFYTGGLNGLQVHWLPIGTHFRIKEYDGAETLEVFDPGHYFKA